MKKVIFGFTMAAASSVLMAAGTFSLSADDLRNGRLSEQEVLSEVYGLGCTGHNRSPALSWKNAPAGTQSFVLTVYDRDAPTGMGWVHWVVANIPAHVRPVFRQTAVGCRKARYKAVPILACLVTAAPARRPAVVTAMW